MLRPNGYLRGSKFQQKTFGDFIPSFFQQIGFDISCKVFPNFYEI